MLSLHSTTSEGLGRLVRLGTLGICVQGFGSLHENDTKSLTVNLADDKIQLLPHAASEFRQRRNWSAGGARRTA